MAANQSSGLKYMTSDFNPWAASLHLVLRDAEFMPVDQVPNRES